MMARGDRKQDQPGSEASGTGSSAGDDARRARELERLRHRVESLEAMVRHNPDLMARFDRNHRHLYVNPAVERATGLPVDAFIGRTNEELGMDPELCRRWNEARERVFRTGEEHRIEFVYDGPDGPRVYQSRIVPEPGPDGRVATVLGITRDVTGRHRASEALDRKARELDRQHDLLRAVTDNTSAALFMMDPQSRCTFMNPAAERMTGYRLEEIRDVRLHDAIHHTRPDGSAYPSEECPIDRALPDGRPVRDHEAVLIRKDGSFFPVLCYASPIEEGGRQTGTVVEVLDLSAQKRAEVERERLIADLQLERSRLHSISVRAPALIAVVRGPDHVFESANPAYLATVGGREVIGRRMKEVLPELEAQGFVELLDRVYETGETYVGKEAPVSLGDQPGGAARELYLNFVFQPLVDADGSVGGIFFHGVDVTELVRAREDAKQASEAKSEFLATVSHELRTPLNAIIGYTDLLMSGIPAPLPDAARHHVERVGLSARHLIQLIEEVLAFSRLEAGQESVQRSPVAVRDLVEEVAAIIEPLAEAKGLSFSVQQPHDDVVLDTDPRKLRQVLLNLAGNAVKFTEQGGIEFQAVDNREAFTFVVRDTGIGIDPAHQDRIFEPFWQAERASQTAGGTGLGLTVARKFIDMLGGELEVDSSPGRGTTFVVSIPLEARRRQTVRAGRST